MASTRLMSRCLARRRPIPPQLAGCRDFREKGAPADGGRMGLRRKAGVLGHLRGFRSDSDSSSSSRAMGSWASPKEKHIPIVVHNLLSVAASRYKLSSTNGSFRSISTWGSVDENEIIKAFENFLSTIEDNTISTKEMCSMYIERLIRSGNLVDAVYMVTYLHNRQIHLGLVAYNILLNAAAEADEIP